MELYSHQQEIIDNNPARHLLAFDVGTGKTLIAIRLANLNCKTCIVVTIKTLKQKWINDINSEPSTCQFFILTKEEFKAQHRTLPAYDGVIIDEAHWFAGVKSGMSKTMIWYCNHHNIKYRWLLSATPYLSTPYNIFTLARILGYDWNYYRFTKKYFHEIPMGTRTVVKPRPNLEREMAELVRTIGSVMAFDDMEHVYDLPNQHHILENFERTPEQQTAIDTLYEPNFITRWTKAHTIENGILYSDGYTEKQVYPCTKNDRLIEIIDSHKKVAVFARYTEQIEMLENLLRERGYTVFTLTGKTKDRQGLIDTANQSADCVIIIQSQISEGYELPGFSHIVFMSMSFSFKDYKQGMGRFLRANAIKENWYYHLVTDGVDKDVYNSIMKKQDFSFEMYGK
jgi:superfamily II DNA or RNA helicase